jgi:hypothetical protein
LPSPERHDAWQCIGCGRIDGPRPCLGICRDRKVELVDAAHLDRAHARIAALESLLQVIARTTPRDGGWEDSWRRLQARARLLLAG